MPERRLPAPPPDTERGTEGETEGETEGRRLRGFVVRASVFLAPLLFGLAVLEGVLWWTGDAWPVERVVALQQDAAEEVLFDRAHFSDRFATYKLEALKQAEADLLVVGSSRVMQFRDFTFHPLEDRFYNAGGIFHNAYDLEAFGALVEAGEVPAPEVIVVGIDPWWLKTNEDADVWIGTPDPVESFGAHIQAMRTLLRSGITEALALSEWTPRGGYYAIGSRARRHGTGFRRDGSYRYPPRVLAAFASTPRYEDRESPPIIERVRTFKEEFNLPAEVGPERVEAILAGIAALRRSGAEVHAFLPPFSTEVFDALETTPELRPWWRYYRDELPALLEAEGASVVAVASPAEYGLDDTYFYDGFHPSEVFMGHVAERLVAAAPAGSLLREVERPALRARLQTAALPLAFELPERHGDPVPVGAPVQR